jgi:hypothetical protein
VRFGLLFLQSDPEKERANGGHPVDTPDTVFLQKLSRKSNLGHYAPGLYIQASQKRLLNVFFFIRPLKQKSAHHFFCADFFYSEKMSLLGQESAF